jgi:hypothetical protein
VTVVTTLVCFFILHAGCGRIERPAFPAPLISDGGKFPARLARTGGEIAKVCLDRNADLETEFVTLWGTHAPHPHVITRESG